MMPAQDLTARQLLDFYLEAGADALVGEEAIDRFAAADEPAAPRAARAPLPAAAMTDNARPNPTTQQAAPQATDDAILAARAAARSASSLDELRAVLEKFEGCALKGSATRLVFADGNPAAKIMVVGEAPGRDEDIEGIPFVGRAGKLLDRMLAAIGLDRTSVYLANVVPWRPPGNRTPTPQETQICLPFVLRQIELANPDILICLGQLSAQALLDTKDSISKTRGHWFTFNAGNFEKREIRAMPTFHPAFLLRSPLQKRFAWRDLLSIKKALAE